jgi:hypothetical protein
MHTVDPKHKLVIVCAALLLAPVFELGATDDESRSESKLAPAAVITKYLKATKNRLASAQNASMQVDITASVPNLKQQGKLRALRKISKAGRITYRVLGFQGDNTIKAQVIARYLQAEQQERGNDTLGITPANYKFKCKGEWQFEGKKAYVFALSPRKKRVGLFKGEIWLDASTYLPVYEAGRFVKRPSVFFKKVAFQRGFAIENGVAIPRYMTSTIDSRVIGKVELTISYSDFVQTPGPDAEEAEAAVVSDRRWRRVSAK